MRIAITGASGFLGSHLVRHFVENGHDVLALKRSASSIKLRETISRDFQTIDVDIQRVDEALRSKGPIDAMVHTASIYGRRGESVSQLIASNVLFGVQMYEVAVQCKVSRFLNIASALPPSLSPYSLSKHQLSEWGRQLVQLTDTRFVNLKLEHFYGPGDSDSTFTAHVIESCLRNIDSLALSARGSPLQSGILWKQ